MAPRKPAAKARQPAKKPAPTKKAPAKKPASAKPKKPAAPPAPAKKNKGGRPKGSGAFRPTPEQRQLVEDMAAYGIPQDDMCRLVKNEKTGEPIALNTLRKSFAEELKTGSIKANVKVVGAMFKNATEKLNVVSQIYWTKNRMGWREAPGTSEGPPPSVIDEQRPLEVARRVAFVMRMGVEIAKRQKG